MFLLLIFLLLAINIANCEETINALFINDELREYADFAIYLAQNYIEENKSFDLRVDMKHLQGFADNYEEFFLKICSTYNKMLEDNSPPHIIIDATKYGIIADAVKSFAKKLAIPIMSTSFGAMGDLQSWKTLTDAEKQYLLQIIPPADTIPSIVRAIVINQNYSTAAIIADESYEMYHKYKSLLQNLATRHIITKLDADNPISQLLQIKKTQIFNIFVIGSLQNIQLVLNGAEAISMFTKKFSWHAITHEADELSCECRRANVVFAQPILPKTTYQRIARIFDKYKNFEQSILFTGFYFDLALYTFLATKKAYKEIPQKSSYIRCEEYDGSNTPHRDNFNLRKHFIKENEMISADPRFNLTENGVSSLKFSMNVEAIEFREGSPFKRKHLGVWSAGYGNFLNLKSPRIMDEYASVIVLRVITVVQRPLMFEDPKAPRKYSGYCVDVLDQIAAMLNFDYEIIVSLDGYIGLLTEDRSWNGMINELIMKRADIAVGAIAVTSQRESVVDFSVPYYEMTGQIILMKMTTTPTSYFRFLLVLENRVWLCILASYIFTSVVMWIFYKYSPYGYKYAKRHQHLKLREFTFVECLWFCFVAFTPQGSGEAPSNISSRVITACWWLFGFLIISSYSANLSAFLTVSRLDSPIKSLEDLSKQYRIQYSTVKNSTTMNYFSRMAEIENKLLQKWTKLNLFDDSLSDYERAKLAVWEYPLSDKFTKMWKKMLSVGLMNSTEEAVKKVQASVSVNEGFAFLTNAVDAKYLAMTNCDLQMIGEEFNKKPFAFAVQKDSPLKEKMNSAILQLYNKRIIQSLREKWWNNNSDAVKCNFKLDSESIDSENIGGIFFMLYSSLGLMILFLVIKYLWVRHSKRKVRSM